LQVSLFCSIFTEKMDQLTIDNIVTTVALLKKVNAASFVSIQELARELKTLKTTLMKVLEDNHKLFVLAERWKPKTKVITREIGGNKFKDTIPVKGASLGLCVEEAFNTAIENYRTPEWLDWMKENKSKYLYITEANNYGCIMGYYLLIDTEHDRYRTHVWRNTPDKINSIKEYLTKKTFTYGGFGDSYSVTYDYSITEESIQLLRDQGWTFNEYKPLSK